MISQPFSMRTAPRAQRGRPCPSQVHSQRHRGAAPTRRSPPRAHRVGRGSPAPRGAGVRANTSPVQVTQHTMLRPLWGSHWHGSPATSRSLLITSFQLFPQFYSSAGHLTPVQLPYRPLSLCSVLKTFSRLSQRDHRGKVCRNLKARADVQQGAFPLNQNL